MRSARLTSLPPAWVRRMFLPDALEELDADLLLEAGDLSETVD